MLGVPRDALVERPPIVGMGARGDRGGVDEPLHARRERRRNHGARAEDIGLVDLGAAARIVGDERRHVERDVAPLHRARHFVGFVEFPNDPADGERRQALGPCEVAAIPNDLVPLGGELAEQRAPDEARGAGDERSHVATAPLCWPADCGAADCGRRSRPPPPQRGRPRPAAPKASMGSRVAPAVASSGGSSKSNDPDSRG